MVGVFGWAFLVVDPGWERLVAVTEREELAAVTDREGLAAVTKLQHVVIHCRLGDVEFGNVQHRGL
jgi:hypothetical protein